jgi:hypothetical protein
MGGQLGVEVHRAESLNGSPVFIRALADIVAQHSKENDAGANGPALPQLLECDMCAAEVVRARAGNTYMSYYRGCIECMNSYWPVRPALSRARRLRPVSPSLCLCLIKALREIKLRNRGSSSASLAKRREIASSPDGRSTGRG